jgi:hypothetical protein
VESVLAVVALLCIATPDGGAATGDAGPPQRADLRSALFNINNAHVTTGVAVRTVGLMRPGDQIHGQAAEVERARLAELGPLATCADRACLEAALAQCKPARLDVYEQRGGCGTEPRQMPTLHAWYAVAKSKRGRCEVLMFGSRGAQVVADRWCRRVPLKYYDLACPDDPDVQRMVAASRPATRPKRR